MLRLIDHWVLAGPVMVEPESVSVRSVRNALMLLPANDPSREVLLGLVNAMQTVREVDVQPVLPRLFAYAGCLEKRLELVLAADVYATINRLAEEEFDGDLLIDSFLRLGYCQRMMGALNEAETSYTTAGKIAKRQKETARVFRSQIGVASVVMARGNLPKADELLEAVAVSCEQSNCAEVWSASLHVRAIVAQRRGELDRAVCLAHSSLKLTELQSERDRVLGDIGAFLIVMRRFDAARDALMVLEATTNSEYVRHNARVNMVVLAARANDPQLFESALKRTEGISLTPESQVNFLIESARGYRVFGEPEKARALLSQARDLAAEHGYNRSVFEAEEMLAERVAVAETASGGIRAEYSEAAADVERDLRTMALAVAE
jgi:Tfp pilus assembly protein PilF